MQCDLKLLIDEERDFECWALAWVYIDGGGQVDVVPSCRVYCCSLSLAPRSRWDQQLLEILAHLIRQDALVVTGGLAEAHSNS